MKTTLENQISLSKENELSFEDVKDLFEKLPTEMLHYLWKRHIFDLIAPCTFDIILDESLAFTIIKKIKKSENETIESKNQ